MWTRLKDWFDERLYGWFIRKEKPALLKSMREKQLSNKVIYFTLLEQHLQLIGITVKRRNSSLEEYYKAIDTIAKLFDFPIDNSSKEVLTTLIKVVLHYNITTSETLLKHYVASLIYDKDTIHPYNHLNKDFDISFDPTLPSSLLTWMLGCDFSQVNKETKGLMSGLTLLITGESIPTTLKEIRLYDGMLWGK